MPLQVALSCAEVVNQLTNAGVTSMDLVNSVLATSSRAVRDAWRHVGPRAVEGASVGRVFAAFLHLFATVPFVVAAVDLALATAHTLDDRVAPILALALFVPLAVVAIVAVTLFVAGALIGAAGVVTNIDAHHVRGLTTMAGGIAAGFVFGAFGDPVAGWTTALVSGAALLSQAATWSIDRRFA